MVCGKPSVGRHLGRLVVRVPGSLSVMPGIVRNAAERFLDVFCAEPTQGLDSSSEVYSRERDPEMRVPRGERGARNHDDSLIERMKRELIAIPARGLREGVECPSRPHQLVHPAQRAM